MMEITIRILSYAFNRQHTAMIKPRVLILIIIDMQGIGATPDAARMQRIVSFYDKLPRGPAPEVKPTNMFDRYRAKHMGKNPTLMRKANHFGG